MKKILILGVLAISASLFAGANSSKNSGTADVDEKYLKKMSEDAPFKNERTISHEVDEDGTVSGDVKQKEQQREELFDETDKSPDQNDFDSESNQEIYE